MPHSGGEDRRLVASHDVEAGQTFGATVGAGHEAQLSVGEGDARYASYTGHRALDYRGPTLREGGRIVGLNPGAS